LASLLDAEAGSLQGTAPSAPTIPVGATQLLADYSAQFEKPLNLQSFGGDEQDTLLVYYKARIDAIAQYLNPRIRIAALGNKTLDPERLGLCLVIPLLHTRDADWSPESSRRLPVWLAGKENRGVLETFCLRAGRPRSAYWFSTMGLTSHAPDPAHLISYFDTNASRHMRNHELRPAEACLVAAVETAQQYGLSTQLHELQMRLLQFYADTDRDDVAANLAQELMGHAAAADFGKLSVNRLKFLCGAKRFQTVIDEVPKYLSDPRTAEVRPQLLYTAWAANSQLASGSSLTKEDPWERQFMQRFPNHPLGADICFAKAMRHLSEGQYDEARSILLFLQLHYPNSAAATKAKEIALQLQSANAARPPIPAEAHK